jgi:hypothetical protein
MMDKQERAARLKAMLTQIAPENAIESVPRPTREGGLESIEEPTPADTGLQKLAQGRTNEVRFFAECAAKKGPRSGQ